MKGTFKKAVALGSAIALVGGLAACGSSSGDGTAELKFQTWNLKNEKFTDYFEGLIDQFEKENPGITIKWVDQPADNYEDKLSTDAAAGELPDVVDMGPEPAYTLASAGILLNLADAVPEAEDDFLPAAWDAATLKGTDLEEGTYGFPWYLNSGPTFYNKAVLEECGITVDPNDPPTKQDDIFAMADTFGSNCGGKYALTSGIPSIQDFGMYGVELMNKDHTEFTFNNAKGVEFVQHYIDMYNAGAFTDDMLNSSTSGESKSFNGGTQAVYERQRLQCGRYSQERPEGVRESGDHRFHRQHQAEHVHGDAYGQCHKQAPGGGYQVRPIRDQLRQPAGIRQEGERVPVFEGYH